MSPLHRQPWRISAKHARPRRFAVSRYAKALIALVPVLLAALKVLSDALGDGLVSSQELVAIAVAALTALGVYAVPNSPPAGQPADPEISERGESAVLVVIAVAVVVIALVLLLPTLR